MNEPLMDETAVQHKQFKWLLPLFFALSAAVIFVPLSFLSADFALLIYFLFACLAMLILISLAISKKGRKRFTAVGTLIVFVLLSWASLTHYTDIRNISRWFLRSRSYKAQVFAEPKPANEEFRHIEWDGWGFAGAGDTTVYLAFAPDNSLAAAASARKSGKFNGLPCEVVRVQKLENHYYSVLFYTDTDWKNCT